MNRMLSVTFLLFVVIAPYCNAQPMAAPLKEEIQVDESARVENFSGKSILIFTPHPDDETFSMGGTIARLVENGNTVRIVIYTNDNRGSQDLDMTRERLAQIRRAEEEAACAILGVPKENITWLGYEDGDLEYADPRVLRGDICRLIKLYKPDAVFSPDPGATWNQWHKTDHRMAANITKDSFIAAEWHLYYPQHLLDEGLKPYAVPVAYYYYSQEPDYEIDITPHFEAKAKAATAHVSQFAPSVSKYTPDMAPDVAKAIRDGFAKSNIKPSAKSKRTAEPVYVERFRREEAP